MLKKTLLFTFAIGLSTMAVAQKKHVEVELIQSNNDTIREKMFIATNLFNKSMLDERAYYKKVYILDDNAKKIVKKIKAKDVKRLSFVFNEIPYTYANDGNQLQFVVYEGRIKWYKRITSNLYDGSISYIDYLKDEKGNEFQLGMYNHKMNKLKELFKDSPTILAELEGKKFSEINLTDILKLYDEL